MKISYIYTRCSLGGLESATKNRMDYLTDYGVDCQALFFSRGFEKQTFIGHKSGIAGDDKRLAALTEDSDIIVNLSPVESIFERLYKLNKPIIHECHCGVNLSYLKSLDSSKVKAVIFPTQFKLNLSRPFLPEDIPAFVIPNCLGKNFLRESYKHIYTVKKMILWVGRIDYFKNWRLLIELAKKIRSDYFIQMVSDISISKEYDEFQKIMQSDEVNGKIILAANQAYDDVYQYYHLASISGCYLSGSMSESFGMTVLEAMGSNCPMVLSDIPAYREIAKDCALYFSPKDTDACLDAIYKICEDFGLRQVMLDKQAKNYSDNFDPIKICGKYVDAIRHIFSV